MEQLFTLVIAPIFVGVVLKFVDYWLENKSDNN